MAMEPRENIREGAHKIGAGVKEGVAQVQAEGRERLSGVIEDVKSRLHLEGKTYADVREDVTSFVKENPGKTLLYAFGVGFALGLIFKR
jgi:hypothetical protein